MMGVFSYKQSPIISIPSPNLYKGSQSHIPSRSNGGTNIPINSETAIKNLEKLAEFYKGIKDVRGFLKNLRMAVGLPDGKGVSQYGEITIPNHNGTNLKLSLRLTNHQTKAKLYKEHNANYPFNLSVVIRRTPRQNTFEPDDDVVLEEYVHYGYKLKRVDNPLSKIAESLIGYIRTGKYEDKTDVAIKNTSPAEKKEATISKTPTKSNNTKAVKDSMRYDRNSYVKILKEMLMKLD